MKDTQRDMDDELRALLAGFPQVELAVLFGSLAQGHSRPGSDIDIAVAAHQTLSATETIALVEALAECTGRPVDLVDNAWVEGIAAIDRKLRLLLESEGVGAVDATPGTPFDPREHEAIVSVPGTGRAEGEIVEEVRRGYRLGDRLIRPALVAVAAAPEADTGPGPGLVN